MALESGTYISDLVNTNPAASDNVSQADDHIRLIKSTILATFPNISGAMTATHATLNGLDGRVSTLENFLNGTTDYGVDLDITKTSATLNLRTDANNYTTLSRDSVGQTLSLSHIRASGQVLMDLSPSPSDGTSAAYVRLFRNTNTTGVRQLAILRGNGSATSAATFQVNGAGDGLDVGGKMSFSGALTAQSSVAVAGTWSQPLIIAGAYLWEDVTNSVLRTKASAPSSETDGEIISTGANGLRTKDSSSEQTVSSWAVSGTKTWAHGKAAAPTLFKAYAICKATDLGYAVGDLIDLGSINWQTTADNTEGIAVYANATNIGVSWIGTLRLPTLTASALSTPTLASNFNIILRGWW